MATELAKVTISESDKRAYKAISLPNGLTGLLISDPETDKAAAAMAVKVGSLSDPEPVQGLAHFLEHMLFLGTEKYPNENECVARRQRDGARAQPCAACLCHVMADARVDQCWQPESPAAP